MNDEPELPKRLDDAIRRLRLGAAAEVDVEGALKRVKARFGEAKVYEFPAGKSIPERSGRGWRSNLMGVAAAVMVLAGGAILWRASQAGTGTGTPMAARVFETGVGQTDTVRLPDGTRVVLAPGTRLTVAAGYGQPARRVDLRGEALFDVVHDDAHPFSVLAGTATIRDIGTTFTVRHHDQASTEVAVTAGSVVLHATTKQEREGIILHAGDHGVLDAGGHATLHQAAVTNADTAFASGRLVFAETPLTAVAAELKRWYGITLRIDDSRLAAQHITASFRGESVQEVLNVIGLAIGVGIELHGDTAVARTRR